MVFEPFGLKTGIDFGNLGLKFGVYFKGATPGAYKHI